MLLEEKETYRYWIIIHRDFPKTERFGIGQKIEQSFLDVLELTFASVYLVLDQKILMLSRTIAKLDNLKFFMQLAWESKLIQTEKYAHISKELEEIGRMSVAGEKGCWKNKNSHQTGERDTIVSRENLITSIPPVRVSHTVRVDIPAIVIPVDVDSTQNTTGILVQKIIHATTH